jgi:transmembrane sensor
VSRCDEQAAAWFIALICAKDTSAVWLDFQTWLHECPENAQAFRAYERLWALWGLMEWPPAAQEPSVPNPVSTRESADGPRQRTKNPRRYLWATLALACFSLVPSSNPVQEIPISDFAWARYETRPNEAHRRVDLPDRSIIELSANTLVDFRVSSEHRQVVLKRGRALFTVESNQAPFEVWVGKTVVSAVGTVFSIARGEHGEVVTIVRRGRVQVKALRSPVQFLSAGETVRVRGDRVLAGTHRERPSDLRPVKGVFNFEDTPLSEAVRAFNHYNKLQLEISDPGIGEARVGGQFSASDPEGFARALDELDIGYVVVKSQDAQSDTIRLAGRHP